MDSDNWYTEVDKTNTKELKKLQLKFCEKNIVVQFSCRNFGEKYVFCPLSLCAGENIYFFVQIAQHFAKSLVSRQINNNLVIFLPNKDVEVRLFQKTIDSAFMISSIVKIQSWNHIIDCKFWQKIFGFCNFGWWKLVFKTFPVVDGEKSTSETRNSTMHLNG